MKWKKRADYDSPKDMILANLGVKAPNDLNEWFKKSYANQYRIHNLKEAVVIAKKFKNQKVTIVGDYDVDGTSATSILYMGLKEYGFKDVSYRIPLRFSEGFGINTSIIDEISEGLIITCDNGIAGIDAVEKAKAKGLSVIITDHHNPVVENEKPVYPDADIIIDPNAIPGSADFNGYCGAGLAYKFICELFGFDKRIRYKYLTLAALGTVADVMQLKEENYVFVRDALKIMHNPAYNTVGLTALVNAFNLSSGVKADDIAFRLGPAINASSRMKDDGAKDAVELLTFDGDVSVANEMAEHLKEVNNQRKDVEASATELALKIIKEGKRENLCPLTVYIPGAREGIIGIVAGKLCEQYQVPTLVFTNIEKKGEVLYKGSARSCGDYNVKEAFDRHAGLFVNYGGHKEAAGMTIRPEKFDRLTTALNEEAKDFQMPDKDIKYYDFKIDGSDVEETIKLLEKFAPFGEGNPEPVFMIDFVPVIKYGNYRRFLGNTGSTVKINGKYLDAISFSKASEFKDIREDANLKILGKLSNNYYKGAAYPQIEVNEYLVEKPGE